MAETFPKLQGGDPPPPPSEPEPILLLFFLPRVMRILDMKLVGRNFFEPAQATILQHYRWVLVTVFSCCCPSTRARDGDVPDPLAVVRGWKFGSLCQVSSLGQLWLA